MNTQTLEMIQRLNGLGFDNDEAFALRRIAMVFDRWNELECGDGNDYGSWIITRGHKSKGVFTHDEDGLPFMEHHHYRHGNGQDSVSYTRIPDRQKGAQKRLAKIMANHHDLIAYEQGDPRGPSLYIVRKSDLNGSDIHSTYTRGVAVYK